MPGVKHLIECHCILALYKASQKIINHKFPVYSKIDENGNIVEKLVKCNNCDAVHLVKEICKSEIQFGKDQTQIILTKEELGYMLPDKIKNFLLKIDADISIWEQILHILEEERWGENIVIKRDVIGENQHVKILSLLSEDKFKVTSEVINDMVV
jgi:hypothetical protein|tara:strand:- start:1000 stop:1464 length:465 start_codon:yes stop_codon:yes gene_type:complete